MYDYTVKYSFRLIQYNLIKISKIMQNNFQHHNFPKVFDIRKNSPNYQFIIPQTHQQIFDIQQSPEHQQQTQIKNGNKNDGRTQDQVMNNLTFSIQDLLSKISKVREEYQEDSQTKSKKKQSKSQTVSEFKISNLSTSTDSNTNKTKKYRSVKQINFKETPFSNKKIQRRAYSPKRQPARYEAQKSQAIKNSQIQQKQQQKSKPQEKNRQAASKINNKKFYQEYNRFQQEMEIPSPQVDSFNLIPNTIKNLLSVDQIHNINSQKKQQWKKSIILDDGKSSQIADSQIEVTQKNKLNSLFDGKKVRQVAASTIMDSPKKTQKISPFKSINQNKTKSLNPFDNIIEHASNEKQDSRISQAKQIQPFNTPFITINGQNSRKHIKQQSNSKKINIRDFDLGACLGSGKFGDVYQATHKQTGFLYAIKKIFKSTILQYNMVQQFTRQLKIHYSLDYPNIIKLYTHFDDQYHVFLVMEYAQGGQVMEKLKSGEKYASQIVQQMLRSVDYMQQHKVAHRDIKPQNIVLMFNDTAKLCDFGWSRIFDSDMKKTFCGTLDYVSPQMKDKGQYTLNIDIWSLGVLTFQIICGFAPFKSQIDRWKQKGSKLSQTWNWNILYPPQVTGVAQSFMRNLLKQNPNQRANIRTCMNHLFIKKYNRIHFNEEQNVRFNQISQILIQ